ncbi:unnamed protein product [Lupinus luteus]|uniref:Glycosyl transferase 64 domain-containing protein n=1 Tax=Lupinus luteus TaxID=3873 RepID=A0AAV1XQB8_LUPLU
MKELIMIETSRSMTEPSMSPRHAPDRASDSIKAHAPDRDDGAKHGTSDRAKHGPSDRDNGAKFGSSDRDTYGSSDRDTYGPSDRCDHGPSDRAYEPFDQHHMMQTNNLALPLVSPLLNGKNYHQWARAMEAHEVTVKKIGLSGLRLTLDPPITQTPSCFSLWRSLFIYWSNLCSSSPFWESWILNFFQLQQYTSNVNLKELLDPHEIATDAVLICDDDVELDHDSLSFAFRVWSTNRNRLVGVFSRSHDLDMNRKEWIYTVQPDRFSIVLTKFMILDRTYLYKYTCEGGTKMAEMRRIVDSVMNCEDILMNFVVADEINLGPLMVGVNRVRDYGDSRNEDEDENENDVSGVGLSSRKGEHRKRRGWCIREFHRVLGRMPLRYSYGKIVDSVGEQGLCRKGGKLVFCDQ